MAGLAMRLTIIAAVALLLCSVLFEDALAKRTTKRPRPGRLNSIFTTSGSRRTRPTKPTTERATTQPTTSTTESPSEEVLCRRAQCQDQCDIVKGKAQCSCSDDRFYLSSDNIHCRPRSCHASDYRKYECGDGAGCTWEYYRGQNLPKCSCTGNGFFSGYDKYILDPKTRSCKRNPIYETCSYPKKKQCGQKCRTVSNTQGKGTHAECYCNDGYVLDKNGVTCSVDNPCKVGNSNGGCSQKCNYNRSTKKVTCSCYDPSSYSLDTDGRTCLIRNCANKNSQCQQGCVQSDAKNFFCTCDVGYQPDPTNDKKCIDVDECAGYHGCDQLCVPDGNHYFKCACRSGFVLAPNGFSCRAGNRCDNHQCSQHCDATTGKCYCDKTHELDSDGKTCVDIDECKRGTDNCQELCFNAEGGFSCGCIDPKARLSNDLRTCIVDTCRKLEAPDYGQMQCFRSHNDTDLMKKGDYCTFTCNRGFIRAGSSVVTCSEDGYDHEAPHCTNIDECKNKLICPKDQNCVDNVGSYTCFCQDGFRKDGDKCVDIEGPKFTFCPKDITLNLTADSDRVLATWTQPTYFDSTDAVVSCENCPAKPEKTFKVGDHRVVYQAKDSAGNKAQCDFKVKVVDITPPVITGCPDGQTFQRGPGLYQLSEFADVKATDNSGTPTVSTDASNKITNPGVTTINYVARDGHGNSATCTFYVNITSVECTKLTNPKNGYHGCGSWAVGVFCTPKCNDGYGFFTSPPDHFHCNNEGEWEPEQPMPDCYPLVKPIGTSLSFSLTYNDPTCPNDLQVNKDFAIEYIKSGFNTQNDVFCYLGKCTMDGEPTISCVEAGKFTVIINTDQDFTKVQARGPILLEFKQKVKDAAAAKSGFMSVGLRKPLGATIPVVDSQGLKATPYFQITCPDKSKSIGNECVTCPGGKC